MCIDKFCRVSKTGHYVTYNSKNDSSLTDANTSALNEVCVRHRIDVKTVNYDERLCRNNSQVSMLKSNITYPLCVSVKNNNTSIEGLISRSDIALRIKDNSLQCKNMYSNSSYTTGNISPCDNGPHKDAGALSHGDTAPFISDIDPECRSMYQSNANNYNYSTSTRISSLRGNVPHENINILSHSEEAPCTINPTSFWKLYEISQSRGDGHCFLYSIISSMKSQHCIYIDKTSLEKRINDECITNSHRYMHVFEHISIFEYRMKDYIFNKIYDSLFGDILPHIVANIIGLPIVIIQHNADRLTVQVFKNEIGTSSSCKGVLLSKTGEHYNGLKFLNTPVYHAKHISNTSDYTPSSPERVFVHSHSHPLMGKVDDQSSICYRPNLTANKGTVHSPTRENCSENNVSNCNDVLNCNVTNVSRTKCFNVCDVAPKSTSHVNDSRELKVCVWNIHGLNQHKLKKDIVGDFLMQNHIILISETWNVNSTDINYQEYELEGFVTIDLPRDFKHINALRGSGGQCIFIRNELYKKRYHLLQTL